MRSYGAAGNWVKVFNWEQIMRVTWEVEDGYVGKSRPQYTEIDDDELAECETKDEREEFIHAAIQHDFEQNIDWSETSREE